MYYTRWYFYLELFNKNNIKYFEQLNCLSADYYFCVILILIFIINKLIKSVKISFNILYLYYFYIENKEFCSLRVAVKEF